MASSSSSSFSSSAGDAKLDLVRKIKTHEVAIVELNNLSSSRAVYQKNGNIFFRSSVQKATAAEQKHLDSAKAKLEKVNAS